VTSLVGGSLDEALQLDAADPLTGFRDRFVPTDPGIVYLDGNSLGRPTKASIERMAALGEAWARRMIRGWDDGWLDLPLTVGDQLAEGVLGARRGEVAVTDSTTVNLYRVASAALDARPGVEPSSSSARSSRPIGTSSRGWHGSGTSRSAGWGATRSRGSRPTTSPRPSARRRGLCCFRPSTTDRPRSSTCGR
jgi:hypothetical protein